MSAGLRLVGELLERLDGLNARHLVAGLVADFDECVDVSRLLVRSEHLQQPLKVRQDMRLLERDVEAELGQSCQFSGFSAREALNDHCID